MKVKAFKKTKPQSSKTVKPFREYDKTEIIETRQRQYDAMSSDELAVARWNAKN